MAPVSATGVIRSCSNSAEEIIVTNGTRQGAQVFDCSVPHCKTKQRCDQAEKKQIAEYHRAEQYRCIRGQWTNQKDRQQGQHAIEKNFAGDI